MRPTLIAIMLVALACTPVACDPGSTSKPPTLDDVLGRVDVPRVLECAAKAGIERAKCLGVEALSVALDVATDRAADAIERARDMANREASAGDVTEADRESMAAELQRALDDVNAEAAKAGAQ